MNNLTKDDIRTVVQRAIAYYQRRSEASGDEGSILVLVPKDPVDFPGLLAEFELYGLTDKTLFFFEEEKDLPERSEGMRVAFMDRKNHRSDVLGRLSQFDRVEVCSPSIGFLKGVRDGADGMFIKVATHFLLKGKPCVMRLPYEPEQIKNGRFAKSFKDLMTDLWDMGASFASMVPDMEEFLGNDERVGLDFINETTVAEALAAGTGHIIATKGAIITPLAAERARELNIQIITI